MCVAGGGGGVSKSVFFQACLIFANKAGPTYSGAHNFMGKLLVLSTNICIIVQSEKMAGTNSLAYFVPTSVTRKKGLKH
jgi:hypothetical protein